MSRSVGQAGVGAGGRVVGQAYKLGRVVGVGFGSRQSLMYDGSVSARHGAGMARAGQLTGQVTMCGGGRAGGRVCCWYDDDDDCQTV